MTVPYDVQCMRHSLLWTMLATCYLQNTEVGANSQREYWVLFAVAVVYKHI